MPENLAYKCMCGSIVYNGEFVSEEELPEGVVILPEPNSAECVKEFYGSGAILEKRVLDVTNFEGERKTVYIPKKFNFCPIKNDI